jgi:hypothetical protein
LFAATTARLGPVASQPSLPQFAVAATSSFTTSPGWGAGGWGLTPWGGGIAGAVAGQFTTTPALTTLSSTPSLAVLA